MHRFRARAASALIAALVGTGLVGTGLVGTGLEGLGAGTASSGPPVAPSPVAATPAAADVWRWPIAAPHPIIRPFTAPETPYAAGHRGIDLATKTDAAVFAPSDGVVSFAGNVVDRPVLSIMHPDDVITTVEPVIALVAVGDRVRAGQRIGTVATGGHCPSGCLHFGVRSHGLYVSPLLFVGIVPRAILLPALR